MYNPILPSSLLQTTHESVFNLNAKVFNNTALRCGTVIETIEIDNPNNISRRTPEYTVMVVEQDKEGGANSSVYKNCVVAESFGAIGDFFEKKLRCTTKAKDTTKSGSLNSKANDGSIVLLLCLNGNAETGIIIASLSHPQRKTTLTPKAGKHLEGEFNGVNWQVNDAGELIVTFKSATDNKGVPIDPKIGNSFFKIDKSGSMQLNDFSVDKTKEKANDYILIDKPNQSIEIGANKNISISAKENLNLSSTKNTNLSCADLVANISGAAGLNVGKDMNLLITGALNSKAKSLDITVDTIAQITAKTLQLKGESTTIEGSTVTVKSPKITLGDGATPAVTSLTQFLGFAGPIPVMSTAIGPFSAVVSIA
jgi:hypothetical protein